MWFLPCPAPHDTEPVAQSDTNKKYQKTKKSTHSLSSFLYASHKPENNEHHNSRSYSPEEYMSHTLTSSELQ